MAWYASIYNDQYSQSPFLQVTNRELSLYLWQDPIHMRVHAKNKGNYLPGFEYAERIGLNPEYAEDYAVAPPELLFLYHTWKRLVGNYDVPRPIPVEEFRTFLLDVPEWQPKYWANAPLSYIKLLDELDKVNDLSLQPMTALPLEVRQAFNGWKNYFYEGNAINTFQPTKEMIRSFLDIYPLYSRPYWVNIQGNDYLRSLEESPGGIIPPEQLSASIRTALFNSITSNL